MAEGGQHDRAADPGMCGDVQGVAGVVVEPGQDLGVGALAGHRVGQRVVGEVGLPAFVGQVGLEADVGRAGSLLRGRGDHPGAGQVAGDGGRRDRDGVVVGQVPADGVWSGVQPLGGQVLAQTHDQVDRGRVGPVRARAGPARAWLERRLTLGPVAGQELEQPRPGDPVGGGHLRHRAALHNDSGDDQTRLRHPRSVQGRRPGCLERSVRDVLTDHTFGRALP